MTLRMRPKVSGPTGIVIGPPVSIDLGAAHQPVRCVHRDRAHDVLAELLRHFEHQCLAAVIDVQCGQDRRQLAVEMDVDDGADDLRDGADAVFSPCSDKIPV